MPRVTWTILGLAVLAGASSCTRIEARTPPPAPPVALETPAPPAKLLIPAPEPIDQPPPPPPDPNPPLAAARPRNAVEPPPTIPPPPPPPPPDPLPVVQTSSSPERLAQQTLDLLRDAERDLAVVATRPMSRDAREQFRTAERFVKMAREALGVRNYSAAFATARKAAAMAGLLVRGAPLPIAP
jgi:hypothetical protein